MKSFKPKAEGGDEPPPGDAGGGRNAERDFHGERRCNDTHASTTDPDARLYRKGRGKEAKLCHMGHLILLNPHPLTPCGLRRNPSSAPFALEHSAQRTLWVGKVPKQFEPQRTVG